jgi:hypothetical protein
MAESPIFPVDRVSIGVTVSFPKYKSLRFDVSGPVTSQVDINHLRAYLRAQLLILRNSVESDETQAAITEYIDDVLPVLPNDDFIVIPSCQFDDVVKARMKELIDR